MMPNVMSREYSGFGGSLFIVKAKSWILFQSGFNVFRNKSPSDEPVQIKNLETLIVASFYKDAGPFSMLNGTEQA